MEFDWMARGRCRRMDPGLFFPSDGVGVRHAQEICAQCSVTPECLRYALEGRIDDGVWGGTSERQRRRLRSQPAAHEAVLQPAEASGWS